MPETNMTDEAKVVRIDGDDMYSRLKKKRMTTTNSAAIEHVSESSFSIFSEKSIDSHKSKTDSSKVKEKKSKIVGPSSEEKKKSNVLLVTPPLKKMKKIPSSCPPPTTVDRDDGHFSDDSDDEFPSFARICFPVKTAKPEIDVKKKEAGYSKGDLVWAKYKNFSMWPAIVSSIHAAKKSAILVFLPTKLPIQSYNNANRFSVKIDKIEPFERKREAYDIRQSFMEKEKQFDFYSAIGQCDVIIKYKLNPFVDEMPIVEVDNDVNTSENVDNAENGVVQIAGNSDDDDRGRSSPLEVSPIDDVSPEEKLMLENRQAVNRKLIEFLKEDETKVLIRQLKEGVVVTRNTREYLENKNSVRPKRLSPRFGPIVDEEQMEVVSNVVSNEYRNLVKNEESLLPYEEFDFNFLYAVLIPESIILATRKVFGLTLEEAELQVNGATDEKQNAPL